MAKESRMVYVCDVCRSDNLISHGWKRRGRVRLKCRCCGATTGVPHNGERLRHIYPAS